MSKLFLIGEVAEELGRVSHTVRQWERDNKLPKELMPSRDDNGWRIWTEDQLEGLKQWLIDADIRPGKGLASNKRQTIIQLEQALEANRIENG